LEPFRQRTKNVRAAQLLLGQSINFARVAVAKTDVLARIELPQLIIRDAAARTHDFDGREAI
jgi:hypothetical protein